MPKNIATSIKDERFLNFFWNQIVPTPTTANYYDDNSNSKNNTRMKIDRTIRQVLETHRETVSADEYPYVSPCGPRELNFIRPAACPVVFHSLVSDGEVGEEDAEDGNGNSKQKHAQALLYGGNLRRPFDPHRLAVSKRTGRMYHQFHDHSIEDDDGDSAPSKRPTDAVVDYGLVRSSVAVSLSERIRIDDDSYENDNHYSGLLFQLQRGGDDTDINDIGGDDDSKTIPIPWLPESSEPDPSWCMPFVDE